MSETGSSDICLRLSFHENILRNEYNSKVINIHVLLLVIAALFVVIPVLR